MKLYNTRSRSIEDFKPLNPPAVTFYSCGPTVYDFTHIGHLRTHTNNDLLKRTLQYGGLKVKHVINITDVGHLTGDTDEGEDKLEKGAKKYNKTVWEVAKLYTDQFLSSIAAMNILPPDVLPKATDHIPEMIALIKKLEEKGFTYQTEEAIYFDISKFPSYGNLSKQALDDKIQKAREEVNIDPQKKHPADFALWFKRVGRFADHAMHWNSPWGEGFPGWHIECSAMSIKYLGETIDIHAGGHDLIPVHHENEIAQSEAATGKQFVRFWFHSAFLMVEGEKMSKSLGNFLTVDDVQKKGIEPMALRYLFFQTHYRQQMNFTWNAAKAAQQTYNKLKEFVLELRRQTKRQYLSEEKLIKVDTYRDQFVQALERDLQLPQAIAVLWQMLKSNIPSEDKYDLLIEFDRVLGLKLSEVVEESIPNEIIDLAEKRKEARQNKNFEESDNLRKNIEKKGYVVEDVEESYRLRKM